MNRTRQAGTQRSHAKLPETSASLSIVLVSAGSPDARLRAATVLLDSSACFDAQVVVVSQGEPDAALDLVLNRHGAQVVTAPVGSTRAEMCDLGMRRVTGSIVAVRDDVDVGDAAWLEAFRQVVPTVEPLVARDLPMAVGAERVVMDSMVPMSVPRGESQPAPRPLADRFRVPAAEVEMAAII